MALRLPLKLDSILRINGFDYSENEYSYYGKAGNEIIITILRDLQKENSYNYKLVVRGNTYNYFSEVAFREKFDDPMEAMVKALLFKSAFN